MIDEGRLSEILDAGCGSLAFTAKTYAGYSDRPVVLLDRSLRLLRMAKERLTKRCGEIPANIVLVHGDALQLPFEPQSFTTIISLNLLHMFEDVAAAFDQVELPAECSTKGNLAFIQCR